MTEPSDGRRASVIQTDASGTANATTGASSVSLPLSSRVYITGNTTSPCPKCSAGACTYGKSPGGSCTVAGSLQTSIDCQPSFAGFQAPLPVNLTPLTSGTAQKTDAAGNFCPGQSPGAFGQAGVQRILETGSPAGDLTDGLPHVSRLASVFCVPATGSASVDGVADLPGPGAINLNGNAQLQ